MVAKILEIKHINKELNPRLPEGVLQSPVIVLSNNFFGQPKVAKQLYVIFTNPINAFFHKNKSQFGGAVWVGGVVKVVGRRGLMKL